MFSLTNFIKCIIQLDIIIQSNFLCINSSLFFSFVNRFSLVLAFIHICVGKMSDLVGSRNIFVPNNLSPAPLLMHKYHRPPTCWKTLAIICFHFLISKIFITQR